MLCTPHTYVSVAVLLVLIEAGRVSEGECSNRGWLAGWVSDCVTETHSSGVRCEAVVAAIKVWKCCVRVRFGNYYCSCRVRTRFAHIARLNRGARNKAIKEQRQQEVGVLDLPTQGWCVKHQMYTINFTICADGYCVIFAERPAGGSARAIARTVPITGIISGCFAPSCAHNSDYERNTTTGFG